MSKRSPKRRRRTLRALGLASVSLSMASGACAVIGEANASTPPQQTHEIFLAEEEISDVSLATFYVFDKEKPSPLQLARGGCGSGCGGGVAVMAAVAMAAAVVALAMQAALAALMQAALAVATSAALVAARTWADALIWEDVTWAGATVVAVAMDAASSWGDASAALAAAEVVAMAAAAMRAGRGRQPGGFTAARLTHRRQRQKDSDQR